MISSAQTTCSYKQCNNNFESHEVVFNPCIAGIDRISRRFADKLLFILSKYDRGEDRKLIFECVNLMVTKVRREQGYRSIEY